MALPLNYDFEGGTLGNQVLTTDTGSGDAFDAVTGTVFTYDNAHVAHGSMAGKVNGSNQTRTWSTKFGTQTEIWGRFYFWIAANPSSIIQFTNMLPGNSGRIRITTAGNVQVWDGVGTAIAGAVSIALNAWNRIEFHVKAGTTNGIIEVNLYKTMDSLVADENIIGSVFNNGANFTSWVFGYGSGSPATDGWIDDVNVNSVGFPGPAVAATPNTVLGYASEAVLWARRKSRSPMPMIRGPRVDKIRPRR